MNAIQIIAAILGISGAILVTSLRSEVRFVAFLTWIVSNILLAMVYVSAEMWSLVAMIVVYTGTSIFGAWHTRPRSLPAPEPEPVCERREPLFSAEQTKTLVHQLLEERAKSSRLQDEMDRIQRVLESKYCPHTRCYVLHEDEAALLKLKLV
jgi:hypothetical protein